MLNRFEKFTFFIEEISRALHKIMTDEMEIFGLKGPTSIYLILLAMHPEGLTVSSISERCGRDKADVSRSLAALTEKGLTTKKCVNNSNYRALIVLTDRGEDAAARLRKKVKSAVEYASHGLSDEDRERLYTTLEIIYTNLCIMCRDGVPDGNDA
jgi:DNA-binding MarR family transcriptional regulator